MSGSKDLYDVSRWIDIKNIYLQTMLYFLALVITHPYEFKIYSKFNSPIKIQDEPLTLKYKYQLVQLVTPRILIKQ